MMLARATKASNQLNYRLCDIYQHVAALATKAA